MSNPNKAPRPFFETASFQRIPHLSIGQLIRPISLIRNRLSLASQVSAPVREKGPMNWVQRVALHLIGTNRDDLA